jgi:hypothetical protein
MSYATTSTPNAQPYGGSVAASIYDRSLSGLTQLGNRYAGNETVGGLVIGSLADIYRTEANTAAQLNYNDAMMSSMYKYQSGLEKMRMGNSLQLLAADTAMSKELGQAQVGWNQALTESQGRENRLNIGASGEDQRKTIGATGEQDRLGYRVQGEEQRKTAIATQDNQADNTIRLREHAKGSIRQQGGRYYG